MYWLIVRSIFSSVIGSTFYQWFAKTKVGVWFQAKVDHFLEYLATKYNIEIAKKEEKWLTQYPRLAERILLLEANMHPPVSPGGATELKAEISLLKAELEELKQQWKKTQTKTN